MAGLSSIYGLAQSVGEVQRDLYPVYTKSSIEEKQSQIVEFNVKQLYDFGINSLGVKISDYAPYAPYTIYLKYLKGQPADRVTLRDTGAFHESFYLEPGPDSFRITAADGKTNDLVMKYGAAIFGLTQENVNKVASQIVYPSVMRDIRLKIFGHA